MSGYGLKPGHLVRCETSRGDETPIADASFRTVIRYRFAEKFSRLPALCPVLFVEVCHSPYVGPDKLALPALPLTIVRA